MYSLLLINLPVHFRYSFMVRCSPVSLYGTSDMCVLSRLHCTHIIYYSRHINVHPTVRVMFVLHGGMFEKIMFCTWSDRGRPERERPWALVRLVRGAREV
jgi:hypothetical protein